MSQVKISELTATTSATGTDVLAGVQGDTTKKFEVEQVLMSQATTDTRWDDLRVPVTATRKGGSKDPDFAKAFDDGSASQGVFVDWFDKTTEEELYFTAQFPHLYKEGTDLYLHVHWIPKTDGASGKSVSWGCEYSWANMGDTFPNTTISYGDTQVQGDTILEAGKHYYTAIETISGTGKTISSMLIGRVFRDAASTGGTDDYDDDAGLLELDFHYEIDALGSSLELVK